MSTSGRRLRAGRRTNLALGWLLAACFVTGFGVFAAGGGTPARLVVVAHGVVGLAVVALVPWKRVIVRRSRRSLVVGVVLSVLVGVTVLSGLWQTLLGYGRALVLSPVQVHVGAALLLVPLLVWHVVRRRRFHRRPIDPTRRDLLRGAGAAGAVAVGYGATAGVAAVLGAQPRVATGSRPLDPDRVPATVWLFDRVPDLDATTHRVDVAGRVLDVDRLRDGAEDVLARLDCTSGWYADVTWSGRRLSDLLPPEQLAAARSVTVHSVTGYRRSFPARDASGLWLAVAAQGRPLSAGRGAPVRLVAPGRRGFWWVKWVDAVTLEQGSSWVQPPFPLQ